MDDYTLYRVSPVETKRQKKQIKKTYKKRRNSYYR